MPDAPEVIGGAHVVLYSSIDRRHSPTGGCRHLVAGVPQGPAAGFAICQYAEEPGSFYLFGCDDEWNIVTDTWHESVQDAMQQAEFEYAGVWRTWLNHERAWESMAHDAEERAVWDLFYERFRFRPSIHPADWPGINEPTPSITFDIRHVFPGDDAGAAFEQLNEELLTLYKAVVTPGERMWALDWQHPCFRFNPFGRFTFSEMSYEMIPAVPNGDYSIFLADDFSFGTFGHPWELTICVSGEPLLKLIERERPAALARVIRRNGVSA